MTDPAPLDAGAFDGAGLPPAEAFDATFAESVGAYLRTYVAARLAERGERGQLPSSSSSS